MTGLMTTVFGSANRGNEMNNEQNGEFSRQIMVTEKSTLGRTARPAGVNWSAIGTCTPDETRRFAAALLAAADEADRRNAE